MLIYKITNKVNGKIYIGCTVLSLTKRFNAHYWKRYEGDTALKRALSKYGKEAFEITQIDSASTREEMLEKEKYWIGILDSMNSNVGYNLHEGGFCLGRNATIDEKEANRRRNIGKVCQPETRLKISMAQKGHPRSKESIEKARLKKTGKKQTVEHIEKCRLTRIGKKRSLVTKKRISVSNLGQKRSNQTKLNISFSRKDFLSKHPFTMGKNILCLNNGKVYLSHQQASEKFKIPRAGITSMLNGRRPHTHGYVFQTLTAEHLIF